MTSPLSSAAADDDDDDMARPLLADTFNNNNDHHQQHTTAAATLDYRQLSAMLSNFSTSYNVVNISLVLPLWTALLMEQQQPTEEETSSVAASLLGGMILGQVLGGLLGDIMAPHTALTIVMVMQVVASLASAVVWFVSVGDWERLAWFRLVLGVGAGGVYPLAAVLSANDTNNNDKNNDTTKSSLQRVVLTFSMQGVGFLAVPLVAMVLLRTGIRLELVWRWLLGLGCVPGIVLLCVQWLEYRTTTTTTTMRGGHHHPVLSTAAPTGSSMLEDAVDRAFAEEEQEREDESSDVENESVLDSMPDTSGVAAAVGGNTTAEGLLLDVSMDDTAPVGLWQAIRHEENIVRKLLGTAATWFLFDVLFYGNTLFQPIVMEAAFGARKDPANDGDPRQLLQRTAEDSFLLTAIALPGYFLALLFLGQSSSLWCYCGRTQSPRFVMLQGFGAMAVLYAIIGTAWHELRHYPSLLLFLYGLTFLFANYGPNTTTFVMPSLVYSDQCRSTLNGLCAAAGKLGALCGASIFAPAATRLGDAAVMLLCAGIAVVAFVLTQWCVVEEKTEPAAAAAASMGQPQPQPQQQQEYDAVIAMDSEEEGETNEGIL